MVQFKKTFLPILEDETIMNGVREYNEENPILFKSSTTKYDSEFIDDKMQSKTILINRPIIVGVNEGGHNSVEIDLLDLLDWIRKNKPELLNK